MAEVKTKTDLEKDTKTCSTPKPSLKWKVLDLFISYVFFAPLVVAYWRGTWSVMDTYVAPKNNEISGWVSAVIGISILFTFTVLQELPKRCTRKMHWVGLTILTRLNVYVVGFGAVNLWRGVWFLWDHYTGKTAVSAGVCFAVGVLLLCVCRGLKNINAPPLVIAVDRNHNSFDVPTRFKTSVKVLWKYVLDSLFTVLVVGVLVVFVWRGCWVFFDSLVYPGTATKPQSALVSYIAGFVVAIIYAFIQFPAMRFSKYLSTSTTKRAKYGKIIFEQVYWLIGFFGPLNIWRGYWFFMDLYLLPQQPVLSRWITHIVGFVGLTLIVNFSSVLVKGCLIDGDMPEGTGVELPTQFVQSLRNDRKIFANAEEVRLHQLSNSQETKATIANGESTTVRMINQKHDEETEEGKTEAEVILPEKQEVELDVMA